MSNGNTSPNLRLSYSDVLQQVLEHTDMGRKRCQLWQTETLLFLLLTLKDLK